MLFPKLFVSPIVCTEGDQEGMLLIFKRLYVLDFQAVGKANIRLIVMKASIM